MPSEKAKLFRIKGSSVSNRQVWTQSILDCRKSYSDLSDVAFSKMFAKKYGISASLVLQVLGSSQGPGGVA